MFSMDVTFPLRMALVAGLVWMTLPLGAAGVVVEQAAPQNPGALAGLRAGDTITAWSAGAARGDIASPFDFDEVELEAGSRGHVQLKGSRGGRGQTWDIG